MFTISSDELQKGDAVEAGDQVHCKACGQHHPLRAATDAQGQPSSVLLFYSCGPDSFLGAVAHRLLPGVHLYIPA